MAPIEAIVKGRRLEVEVPADWPDGTEVEVHPVEREANGVGDGMSPDEIVRTLAAMDRMEPFDMTDGERAAWEAERQARKECDKVQFVERAERLRKEWE